MRIVLQRVKTARVLFRGRKISEIGKGILILLGVHQDDTPDQARVLAQKCAEVRIFPDAEGKMNLSAKDIGGSALVVSQFTLLADCRKGRRPNFMAAALPDKANELYEFFVAELRRHLAEVGTGEFGAMMEVELVNDGPVTLFLERNAADFDR